MNGGDSQETLTRYLNTLKKRVVLCERNGKFATSGSASWTVSFMIWGSRGRRSHGAITNKNRIQFGNGLTEHAPACHGRFYSPIPRYNMFFPPSQITPRWLSNSDRKRSKALSSDKNNFALKLHGYKRLIARMLSLDPGNPFPSQTQGIFLGKKFQLLLLLSRWGKLVGKDTKNRIKELEQSLVSLRQNPITGTSKARELRAKEELSKLISQEEIFWKQRSKALWLKEGDRNSSFFHANASRRFQTNYIQKIKRADGDWTDSVEDVQQCILDYF
ncbi:UNVERIFIED_CONTAM: hypothetical protein Sradi_0533000 [Sesamum radiatum]|uniref:Uncharacterized protein n=1 Tax=Sesamum radiatum TaxID=300843 RepID=A0AAW2VI97_SESRA